MISTFDNFIKGFLAVLVGLVGYYFVATILSSAAEEKQPPVPREQPINLDFGPTTKRADKVYLHKATFEYECVECHAWQERDPSPREFIGEHSKMNLEHGSLKTCFTCHHETEYDQLVDPRDGSPLAYNKHVSLCVRCHGPVYKDWKYGAHGRRGGYWDKSQGEQTRTECIICHDPHQPAFKPIAPLPRPGVARGAVHAPSDEPHTRVGKLLKHKPIPKTVRGPAIVEWEIEDTYDE